MEKELEETKTKIEFDLETSQEEFEPNTLIIDQILDKYGYGFKVWIQIFLYFFTKMLEGISFVLIPLLVIPFRKMHSIHSFQIFLVSSGFYLGTGLGSIVAGYILRNIKRATLIRLCVFFFMLSYITFSIFQKLIVIAFCRFFMGTFLGVQLVVTQCCLTEYLPVENRALMMSIASSGTSIGALLMACIFLIFTPNLQEDKIQITLLMSSILVLLIFVYISSVAQDSPRNLILNDCYEEGIEILESFHGKKLKDSDKNRIREEINSFKQDHPPSLKDIFTNYYYATSVLLIFVITIIDLASQGPVLVSGFTIKSLKQDSHSDHESNRHVILNQITIWSLIIPMQFLGGFLSEIKNLGRKRAIYLCFFVSIMFFSGCCIFYGSFSLLLGFGLAFLEAPATLIIIYANEIYSTLLRDMALGFLTSFKSLGGFLSQIVYIEIRKVHIFAPYYFTILILVIAAILVFFLPYETSGKSLDFDYSFQEEPDSERKQLVTK